MSTYNWGYNPLTIRGMNHQVYPKLGVCAQVIGPKPWLSDLSTVKVGWETCQKCHGIWVSANPEGEFQAFSKFSGQQNGQPKLFAETVLISSLAGEWLPSSFNFPMNLGFRLSSQWTNSIIFQRGSFQPPTSDWFEKLQETPPHQFEVKKNRFPWEFSLENHSIDR